MEKIIRENAFEHKKKKPGLSAHRPSKNRAQVAEAEQEVIITNNNLLFHYCGHNNDLLVLKQRKGALDRTMPSLLGLLKNNNFQKGLGSQALS